MGAELLRRFVRTHLGAPTSRSESVSSQRIEAWARLYRGQVVGHASIGVLHVGPPGIEARIERLDADLADIAAQGGGIDGADLREPVVVGALGQTEDVPTLTPAHFVSALARP